MSLLLVVTAIVFPILWNEIGGDSPPICSKGGVAVVFPSSHHHSENETEKNSFGKGDPYLFIFSGNGKHGRLVHTQKTYNLRERLWGTVYAIGDERNQHLRTQFQEDGIPTPRWKSVAVLVNETTMAMFGGSSLIGSSFTETFSNDLWLLSTSGDERSEGSGEPTWSYVDFASDEPIPLERRAHAASKVGSGMYVFGGKECHEQSNAEKDECQDLGDLWVLDFHTLKWTKLWEREGSNSSGPSPRHGHTACTARVHGLDYFVVFGGRADKEGYFNDVWAFNTHNSTWMDWTPDYDHSTTEFFPSKRDHHHVASVDSLGGENPKMVLFGGRGAPASEKHQHKTSRVLNDLWQFDYVLKEWKEIEVKTHKPAARFLADFTQYDAVSMAKNESSSGERSPKLLIFGGDEAIEFGARVDDLWELDIRTNEWQRLEQSYRC